MFSSTKRKRSHQEQLSEDSLFLDGPAVDELQTIQKRKDPECSRDTQVKNQALYDYVDGLTITMNVIQPSSAIHHHRMCYKCGQKGHYAKSCPQKRLSPVAQDAQNDQDQQQVIPVCSDRTKRKRTKEGPKEYQEIRHASNSHHVGMRSRLRSE